MTPADEHSRTGVVVEARGLHKRFGAITALDGVDLEIRAGEVTAIVGDNGAGKSTLIKILCGAIRPDAGEIRVKGQPVSLRSPLTARELGIETVFQDLALAPNRDVTANVFLGRELSHRMPVIPVRILARREMRRIAAEHLEQLAVNIPRISGTPISHMSGGQRQAVAVARALFWATNVMYLDEPTAALGVRESKQVMRLARDAADRGLAVVLISHILPHVMELADRVVVMRHGRKVAELTDDISSDLLVRLIVGVDPAEEQVLADPRSRL